MNGEYEISDVKLLDDLKRRRHLFMAGAGISSEEPSFLSSISTFMNVLINYGAIDAYYETIKAIPSLCYEVVVQNFRDAFDSDLTIIDYFMQDFEPNIIHYCLAESILKGKNVITTNLDTLIENALLKIDTNKDQKFKAVITRDDFDNQKYSDIPTSILYKMNGSPSNYFTKTDTKTSIVTTLDSVSTKKELDQPLMSLPKFKQKIVRILDDFKIIIVIGYGSKDLFDIMPVISLMNHIKGLFWIEHRSDLEKTTNWVINDTFTMETEVDIFLSKLKESKVYPIYKIKANTRNFIEHFFNPKSYSQQKSNDKVKDFQTWFNEHLQPQSELAKWYFTLKTVLPYHKYPEIASITEKMLLLVEQEKDSILKCQSLNLLASIYQDTGEKSKVLELSEEALAIGRKLDSKSAISAALVNLGIFYEDIGYSKKALEFYKEAYELKKEQDDALGMAEILGNMAVSTNELGLYTDSAFRFSDSDHIYEDLGNELGKNFNLTSSGVMELELGENTSSLRRDYFEQAWKVDKRLNNQSGTATNIINLCRAYQDIGNVTKANELIEQADAIVKGLKNKQQVIILLSNMGSFYQSAGNPQKALELHEQAYAIAKEMNNPVKMAMALTNMGLAYENSGNENKVIEFHEKSYSMAKEMNNPLMMTKALTNMGLAYENSGNVIKAIEQYEQVYTIAKEINNPLKMAMARKTIGLVYENSGNESKAIENYEKAYELHEEIENAQPMGFILLKLSAFYKKNKEIEKALKYYEKASIANSDTERVAFSIYNKALIYFEQNDLKKALSECDLALYRYKNLHFTEGITLCQELIEKCSK